jgi:Domain of unknown function (DUF4157)
MPIAREVAPVAEPRASRGVVAPVRAPDASARDGSATGAGPAADASLVRRADSGTRSRLFQGLQRQVGNRATQRLMTHPPAASAAAHVGYSSAERPAALPQPADGDQAHELEANRAAADVVPRLQDPGPPNPGDEAPGKPVAASGSDPGAGRPVTPNVQDRYERAFGWDFSGVRLHTDGPAADTTAGIGAKAATQGRDIAFGAGVGNPESGDNEQLMAHELAHVVQVDKGAGAAGAGASAARATGAPSVSGATSAPSTSSVAGSLSAAPAATAHAAPAVTNVATSAGELGVGGRDITATATVAPKTPLTWTINGGAPPTGVAIIGTGRTVRIHAGQPGGGTIVGGTPLTIRAAVTATPGDFFDAPPVNLIQVATASYAANPALAPVPSLIPGNPPANSAEPNRDGIAGNSAVVNAITAPAGRPITIAFRRALGAKIAGTTVTPGSQTGDIGLRITDTATAARMDEAQPAVAGPAALMADLTVNAVPTKVSSLAGGGGLGPYGVLNTINFASSDNLHLPLVRVVGELITLLANDFNAPPPNAPGGFNNAFLLGLAVPANNWNDQLVTPSGMLNVADALPAIDVNRFIGPGVPGLPRRWTFRQRMQYASWQGAGGVVSKTIADGKHIRSLIGKPPAAFQFKTEHVFGAAKAPARVEPYLGNPLIILSAVRATPTAAGATALAADGAATANLGVASSVAGRTVNWTVRTGDSTITGGNPAALPATATLQAGVKAGTFALRVADSVFPNRRADGTVRVAAVKLRGIRATPGTVPVGVNTAAVSVTADPGARTLNWTVDGAAAAAGVTVTATSGPGLAMNVVVTRPAGFKGKVKVKAADSVLATRTTSVTIKFK